MRRGAVGGLPDGRLSRGPPSRVVRPRGGHVCPPAGRTGYPQADVLRGCEARRQASHRAIEATHPDAPINSRVATLKSHAHGETLAVGAVRKLDGGAVRVGDPFDDGEAEAATRFARRVVRPRLSIEALEDAPARGDRNACPLSMTDSTARPASFAMPTSTRPPLGVKRARVVEQVGDEGRKTRRIALHGNIRRFRAPEVDAPRVGDRRAGDDGFLASATRSARAKLRARLGLESRHLVSSCSTRRDARATPASRSAIASGAGPASVARPACSTCSASAASGVRSSCAASAVNRRCAASASSRRASRALRLAARGLSSRGSVCTSTGDSASSRCISTSRDSASSGRSPRPTAYQIRMPSSGISSASGKSVRSAACAAISRRSSSACAICSA